VRRVSAASITSPSGFLPLFVLIGLGDTFPLTKAYLCYHELYFAT